MPQQKRSISDWRISILRWNFKLNLSEWGLPFRHVQGLDPNPCTNVRSSEVCAVTGRSSRTWMRCTYPPWSDSQRICPSFAVSTCVTTQRTPPFQAGSRLWMPYQPTNRCRKLIAHANPGYILKSWCLDTWFLCMGTTLCVPSLSLQMRRTWLLSSHFPTWCCDKWGSKGSRTFWLAVRP